jgi:hypothetical protein
MSESHNTRMMTLGVSLGLSIGGGLGVVFGAVMGALTQDMGTWIVMSLPTGAGMGLTVGIAVAVLNQRTSKDLCPTCGYPTTGLPGNTCPECGTDRTEQNDLASDD